MRETAQQHSAYRTLALAVFNQAIEDYGPIVDEVAALTEPQSRRNWIAAKWDKYTKRFEFYHRKAWLAKHRELDALDNQEYDTELARITQRRNRRLAHCFNKDKKTQGKIWREFYAARAILHKELRKRINIRRKIQDPFQPLTLLQLRQRMNAAYNSRVSRKVQERDEIHALFSEPSLWSDLAGCVPGMGRIKLAA